MSVLFNSRSFTANSETKVAVLLRMNRCGSFPLLSAPHSLSLATEQTLKGPPLWARRYHACLSRSGSGFDPRSEQVSWVRFFRGFSSPARQMSWSFRPPTSPNIIWPSLSSSLIIHYGRQWPEMLTRPKTLNIHIHTDLKRSEKIQGTSMEVRRVDLANWDLRILPKFTTGVKYQFHKGFCPDQRSGNPSHLSPPIYIYIQGESVFTEWIC